MSSNSGDDLSFDPRTWVDRGLERTSRTYSAPERPRRRALLAALSGLAILSAGAAAAYATRSEPKQEAAP